MDKKIRIGYIGLGRRGKMVLDRCFSKFLDAEVVTICDKRPAEEEPSQKILMENGGYTAKFTTEADDIFNDKTIDAVVIMTGWNDRLDLVMKSMRAGKYTAFEVGCAFTLEECFALLETYKETKMPVMILENCCYGRREMMALNLDDKGLFGEIIHCEGGYHHYLNREDLLKEEFEENVPHHYRIDSYISRNCENYPTHELGPISKLLKINRGNRMVTLSSFASKARGIKTFANKHLGPDNKYSQLDYAQADIVNTIITCANGETIKICLDTTLPRAYYSRNFTVRGTDAMYTEERKVLYFEGEKEEIANNEEELMPKYDHPLWKEYLEKGITGGHSGMDWLVCRGFIESIKAGTDFPIDIYDALLWLSIAPLSEMSIKMGGAPVEIPDFTEGKWQNREPIVEGKYCLNKVCVDNTVDIYPYGIKK